MRQEKIDKVEAIWNAVNRGEIGEALEYTPEDFVLDFSSSEGVEGGVYRGREALRHLFESTMEPWSEVEFFAEEYIDTGDQLVRVGGMRARGRGSGADVTARAAQLWTFREGVPVSMQLFKSKEEALEAARSSE